jgi:rare lipoprotein A
MLQPRRAILTLPVLFLAAAGCGRREESAPRTVERPRFRAVEGVASHYADKFVGRRTASGEVYSHRLLTAAHRSLPFGTLVLVTNLDNSRSVVVRINDRGPFARGRLIDLSRRAAEELAMIRRGTARVRLEPMR